MLGSVLGKGAREGAVPSAPPPLPVGKYIAVQQGGQNTWLPCRHKRYFMEDFQGKDTVIFAIAICRY